MQKAHDGIFALRARSEDPRIQSLSDEASALDVKHDDQARGIHAAFSMLAMVSKSSDTFLRLRNLLLPDGLQHLQRTFREEAGHAALVALGQHGRRIGGRCQSGAAALDPHGKRDSGCRRNGRPG